MTMCGHADQGRYSSCYTEVSDRTARGYWQPQGTFSGTFAGFLRSGLCLGIGSCGWGRTAGLGICSGIRIGSEPG
jgi:hypothetical protein